MKLVTIALAIGLMASPALAQISTGGLGSSAPLTGTHCAGPVGTSGRPSFTYPAKPISIEWRGTAYPVTGSVWKNETKEHVSAATAVAEQATGKKLSALGPEFSGVTDALPAGKGVLIASDRGEWGGGLWYVTPSGYPATLIGKNTAALFVLGGQIYALAGLAHIVFDGGTVWQVDVSRATPFATQIATLPGAPRAWTMVADKALLVMTSDKAVAILPGGAVEEAVGRRECVPMDQLAK